MTNHKGLIHLYQQKNLLSRWQAQWLENISEFDITIEYVLGIENVLPNALPQLYPNDVARMVHASTEYIQLAEVSMDLSVCTLVSMPVLVSVDAEVFAAAPRQSVQVAGSTASSPVLADPSMDSSSSLLGDGHGEAPAIKK